MIKCPGLGERVIWVDSWPVGGGIPRRPFVQPFSGWRWLIEIASAGLPWLLLYLERMAWSGRGGVKEVMKEEENGWCWTPSLLHNDQWTKSARTLFLSYTAKYVRKNHHFFVHFTFPLLLPCCHSIHPSTILFLFPDLPPSSWKWIEPVILNGALLRHLTLSINRGNEHFLDKCNFVYKTSSTC